MPDLRPPGAGAPPISDEQRQRMDYKNKLRRKRRKERESAGEIRELNIVAMMDMMTILLVFLLKSYQTTPINIAASDDLKPPFSTAQLPPRDTVAVTVTRRHIMVGDRVVVALDGQSNVPPEYKEGGETGNFIQPLYDALDKEVEKMKYIAQFNPNAPFSGEMSVIGDRKIPYRLLTEILYTAGRAQLDSFRFIVFKKESAEAGGAKE